MMKIKSFVYCQIEKLLAHFTDRIVCISKAEEQSAINNNISNTDKFVSIPNGIDIQSVKKAVPKSRSEIGIKDSTFVVGMVGRISQQKAPDIFIRTAKLVAEKKPDSAFIIVGDGIMRSQIERYARANNLKLFITGWTDEPYSYLKLFDVAVLPSRWEGFGLAIVEFMAAERNVVASRIDAIPTIIEDGVDGLLANVDSPKDFCEKILWLCSHPKEAAEMREKALKKVCVYYDINRVARQHMEMFNALNKE